MEKKLEEELENIIMDLLVVSPLSIVPDARFKEDLGADDLSMLELLAVIEDEFKIEITDEEAEKFFMFKDLIKCINRKLKNRS